MPRKTLVAPYAMRTYRVFLTLTWNEWAKLKAEAQRNGLTGTAQIEVILNDVINRLPAAPSVDQDEPPPVDPGDDMVAVE